MWWISESTRTSCNINQSGKGETPTQGLLSSLRLFVSPPLSLHIEVIPAFCLVACRDSSFHLAAPLPLRPSLPRLHGEQTWPLVTLRAVKQPPPLSDDSSAVSDPVARIRFCARIIVHPLFLFVCVLPPVKPSDAIRGNTSRVQLTAGENKY